MAGITLAQAQGQLDAALSALASARSVKETQVTGSVGGRKTVMHDLQQLQADVQYWDAKCKSLSRGTVQFLSAVPLG